MVIKSVEEGLLSVLDNSTGIRSSMINLFSAVYQSYIYRNKLIKPKHTFRLVGFTKLIFRMILVVDAFCELIVVKVAGDAKVQKVKRAPKCFLV